MRIILDTNVFISGVFFSGPPYEILKAWHDGQVSLVLSPEIFEEYERVGESLSEKFSGVSIEPFLYLVSSEAEIVNSPPLPASVCEDLDDDKFLACAIAADARLIVTGDKELLATSGYSDIEIIQPRKFVDQYLK